MESRSAEAVRAAVRPGRHARGAQGDHAAYASILDLVSQEAADLQRTLDAPRSRKLGDYLESVREIERRVQKMEAQDLSALALPDVPVEHELRRAPEPDVRHDRAGMAGEPHARLHLHDGG